MWCPSGCRARAGTAIRRTTCTTGSPAWPAPTRTAAGGHWTRWRCEISYRRWPPSRQLTWGRHVTGVRRRVAGAARSQWTRDMRRDAGANGRVFTRTESIARATPRYTTAWTARYRRAPSERELLHIQQVVTLATRTKHHAVIDWDAVAARWDETPGGELAGVFRAARAQADGRHAAAPAEAAAANLGFAAMQAARHLVQGGTDAPDRERPACRECGSGRRGPATRAADRPGARVRVLEGHSDRRAGGASAP